MHAVISNFIEHNKKKLIWVGGIFGALFVFWGIIAYLAVLGSYSTYHDEYYKFTIEYPKNWRVVKDTNGAIVAFTSPQDNALDSFSENLNIVLTDIPEPGMTLEKFSKFIEIQAGTVFTHYVDVKESKPITLNGIPAYSYVLRNNQDYQLELRFVWFFKDNKAFIISTAMEMIYYKKHIGKMRHMVNTFKFD